MNQRSRKRTVNGHFHNRLYSARFIWWSAEDRTLENMAPVGCEFGSPDFERLTQEDADQLGTTLTKLVEICSANIAAMSEASEFRNDAINVQKALKELGHDVSLDTAAGVWKHYSNSFLAGWMLGAQTVMGARRAIIGYCKLGTPEVPGPTRWKSSVESGIGASDFKRHDGQL